MKRTEAMQQLLSAATAQPGLHLRLLARTAGVDSKTAQGAVRELERQQLLVTRLDGPARLIWPVREVAPW
jgi:lambda repressor-like predicted transcriptional regulator